MPTNARSAAASAAITREALAVEAQTTPDRIDRLVDIGALKPSAEGFFTRGDAVRCRTVGAFESAGFTLDEIETAIRERAIVLDFIHLFYPDPGPLSGRTFDEFVADMGERGRLVNPVLVAMGLPTPAGDTPTRASQEAMLRALVDSWAVAGDEITLRAARIFGDAARRAAEGWTALFDEGVRRPIEQNAKTLDEAIPAVLSAATALSRLTPELMTWLVDRHLDRTLNETNYVTLERRMQQRGLMPAKQDHPPAVAFVDVTDFTRLTAQGGDELGARTAVQLGELAERAAARHSGRVVKLLGDGVLLTFETSCEAIDGVVDLVTAMNEAGMPPAHSGIHAGPLIARDGDIFGTTVNAAARMADHATAGTIVASEAVMADCPHALEEWNAVGDVAMKGFDTAIRLYEHRIAAKLAAAAERRAPTPQSR